MLLIVVAREVAEDSIPLENGKVGSVVVDNGGDAAVGVDGREPRLLLRVLADVDGLPRVVQPVGFLELLQEDGRFVAVGGAYEVFLVLVWRQRVYQTDNRVRMTTSRGETGRHIIPKVRSSMPDLATRPVGSAISSGLVLDAETVVVEWNWHRRAKLSFGCGVPRHDDTILRG